MIIPPQVICVAQSDAIQNDTMVVIIRESNSPNAKSSGILSRSYPQLRLVHREENNAERYSVLATKEEDAIAGLIDEIDEEGGLNAIVLDTKGQPRDEYHV